MGFRAQIFKQQTTSIILERIGEKGEERHEALVLDSSHSHGGDGFPLPCTESSFPGTSTRIFFKAG
jgi:hypothetical protein